MKLPSPRFPVLSFAAALCAGALSAAETSSPSASLDLLVAGNQRFVSDACTHADQGAARRAEVAKAQHPFAIILTCADSRVAPELYFDQGIGRLFVIRNAGNIVDDHVLGSMEYAVEHLHVPLIVVIGHERCGAVAAAAAGGEAPGHIHSVVESIVPAVTACKGKPGDLVDNAVSMNARLMAGAIESQSPIIASAVKSGHVKIVAARYDLDSGQVEFLR